MLDFVMWHIGGDSFGIVPLLTLVLCGLVIYRAVVAPRGGRRGRCGACDHELTHPLPRACPECGADVVAAGMVNRHLAFRFRGSLMAALIAWTILAVSGGSIALDFLSDVVTHHGTYAVRTEEVRFEPEYRRRSHLIGGDGMVSTHYEVTFHIVTRGFSGGATDLDTVLVEIENHQSAVGYPSQSREFGTSPEGVHLSIDADTKAYRFVDSLGFVTRDGADADADAESLMDQLYKAVKLDLEDATVAEESREAARLLRMCLAAPSDFRATFDDERRQAFSTRQRTIFRSIGGGSSARSEVPTRFLGLRGVAALCAIMGVVGVPVYLAGVAAIIWRRGKLLRILPEAERPASV